MHSIPPFDCYQGTKPYVFVSYCHADSPEVFSEIARMNEEGYRIWFDEGIEPGTQWADDIARALAGSAIFLVFISPRSVNSKNVRDEIGFALRNHKPFVAIHLEETKLPPGLELSMGNIQAILRHRVTPDLYWRKLLGSLASHGCARQGHPEANPVLVHSTPVPAKTVTPRLSLEEFFGSLGQRGTELPDFLRSFLRQAAAFGVYPEIQKALNLKCASTAGPPLNMGTITRDGRYLDTSCSSLRGREKAGKVYNESLAGLIGGLVRDGKDGTSWVKTAGDRIPQLTDFLPKHEQDWLNAMRQYIRACVAGSK